jgi:hypothetical protein
MFTRRLIAISIVLLAAVELSMMAACVAACKEGQELVLWLNVAICYPACKNGYYGAGPICWEDESFQCPDGYTDYGLSCYRGPKVYSKGCCCFLGRCCTDMCHEGFRDDGCTCFRDTSIIWRHSYGRGAGEPPISKC